MEKIALKFLSINHVIMMWKLQADNYDELELFVDDIKRVTERISESKAVAEKCIENLDFILYLNNLGYQSDSIKTAPVLEMIEQLREKFADK
ncbi:MAG: hypothetical protein LBL90_13545 [Prevotellaceae bacterium]|jgi:hypothetical protein|nr:hypothetical protein [Prevotellaceae bacterium]